MACQIGHWYGYPKRGGGSTNDLKEAVTNPDELVHREEDMHPRHIHHYGDIDPVDGKEYFISWKDDRPRSWAEYNAYASGITISEADYTRIYEQAVRRLRQRNNMSEQSHDELYGIFPREFRDLRR